MMQGAGQGGVVSSNAGYSGTPLWKLKQQRQVPNIHARTEEREENKKTLEQEAQEEEEAAERLRVSVDAVSVGRAESGEKPFVRHVIVKDLRKVAARSRITLPTGGHFDGKAPVLLFALFDGQSCAEAPGPLAAEWCSKNLLPKLLRNLSALPPGYENDVFIKATLKKTFEDLDKDLLVGQPAIHDGCGASVALLIGEKLFTAVCGKVCGVLMEAGPQKAGQVSYTPVSVGANQGHCHLPEEQKFLTAEGGAVFQNEQGNTLVSGPGGAVAQVSRSLGDRAWKGPQGGIPGSVRLLRGVPETKSVDVSWGDKHHCLILASAPVAGALSPDIISKVASALGSRPRATAGEVTARASDATTTGTTQCTAMVIRFVPKDDKYAGQPAAKKARKEAESVRLRHIVVRYRDCGQPFDPVRNRPVGRTREEAETMLRRALIELGEEATKIKLPSDAKKVQLAALQPTPKYLALCKEMSECTTSQKGGGMMGDLGWQSPVELTRYGPAFAETAKSLGVGQWSDLTASDHGVHIIQRIA